MNNLKRLLTRPLSKIPNKAVISLLVLALLGFIDATYLAIEHYRGVIPPCSLVSGCEVVLSSPYSLLFGVPVALFGSIYYLFILISTFAYLEGGHEKILRLALFVTVIGLIMSIWFVSVQAFIIHSYCMYCLASATISTIIFVMAVILLKKYGNNQDIQGL